VNPVTIFTHLFWS